VEAREYSTTVPRGGHRSILLFVHTSEENHTKMFNDFDDLVINRKYKRQIETNKNGDSFSLVSGAAAEGASPSRHQTQSQSMSLITPHHPAPPASFGSSSGKRTADVIRRLFQEHADSVERDPLIMRHLQAYYSVLSGHLQDSLDDITAYIKARKND